MGIPWFSPDALQILIVMQTELPACGILHLLHNLYIDMIYGKIKINGCEEIVERVVSFYNTYKGIGTPVVRECKDNR